MWNFEVPDSDKELKWVKLWRAILVLEYKTSIKIGAISAYKTQTQTHTHTHPKTILWKRLRNLPGGTIIYVQTSYVTTSETNKLKMIASSLAKLELVCPRRKHDQASYTYSGKLF